MNTTVIDTEALNRALRESSLTVNQLAYRVGASGHVIVRLLTDGDPGELRLGTLARIADALRIPTKALLADPEKHPTEEDTARPSADGLVDDAQTIIGAIYDRGTTPVLNRDLAVALGWDLDRLHAAFDEADRRLGPSGLCLYRQQGEVALGPNKDRRSARTRLTLRLASEYAMKANYYQTVYQVLHSGKVTGHFKNATARNMVLGALANQGILHLDRKEPSMAAAALFAFPDEAIRPS